MTTFPWVGVLTVLFVALKLTNVIAWSWVWVLSPLWIAIGVGLLIWLGVGITMIALSIGEARQDRRRAKRGR